MNFFKLLCTIGLKGLISRFFRPVSLPVEMVGLTFKNPVGLGAGFDKNARYLEELEALGFGFIEIGTVTPKAQVGNEKPRLFRLKKDKALVNRMGFNNDGVEAVAERLKRWRNKEEQTNEKKATSRQLLIGGNIGKNKDTKNEEAWKDYLVCFEKLHPYVDFFVVNVSSPNTPGLRALQEKDSLHQILTSLQQLNNNFNVRRPVFLKIAPDLTHTQIDDVIELAREIRLDGLVATNTTIQREGLTTDSSSVEAIGPGGLSGMPLRQRSDEVVQYIHSKTGGGIPIIGSGGIFSGRDTINKMNKGAGLVEIWTGFIYEGPKIVKRICNELKQQYERV